MELWELTELIATILISLTFPLWVKILFDVFDTFETKSYLGIPAVVMPIFGFVMLGMSSQIQCNGSCQFYPEEPSQFFWLAFVSAGVSALVALFGAVWKLLKSK